MEDKLGEIDGVESAYIDISTGTLTIEYDVTYVHLGVIVTMLRDAGWRVEPHLFSRVKLHWGCFTEENEQSNLTAPVHPCCEPPTVPNRDGTLHR